MCHRLCWWGLCLSCFLLPVNIKLVFSCVRHLFWWLHNSQPGRSHTYKSPTWKALVWVCHVNQHKIGRIPCSIELTRLDSTIAVVDGAGIRSVCLSGAAYSFLSSHYPTWVLIRSSLQLSPKLKARFDTLSENVLSIQYCKRYSLTPRQSHHPSFFHLLMSYETLQPRLFLFVFSLRDQKGLLSHLVWSRHT